MMCQDDSQSVEGFLHIVVAHLGEKLAEVEFCDEEAMGAAEFRRHVRDGIVDGQPWAISVGSGAQLRFILRREGLEEPAGDDFVGDLEG